MERYQQQIKFLGAKEQEILSRKHVAILGLGALGSVAAELLTRAGIGHITLIDHDIVELSNLQRQSLYDESDLSKSKAISAFEKLQKINAEVTFIVSAQHITEENAQLLKADIVLDCTDNLKARFVINNYCKQNDIPWVHAAAAGSIGTVLPVSNSYCFHCIFSNSKESMTCDNAGILNTVAHTTASIQVTEAIKILLDKPHAHLIRFNLWNNTFENIRVKKNPDCAVCNNKQITNGAEGLFTLLSCKTRATCSTMPNNNLSLNLNKIKEKYETVLETPVAIIIKEQNVEIVVHNYGKLVFRQCSDEKKIKRMAREIYEFGC